MAIPIPGEPVRGSRSGVPIMAVFDLLGRRWALSIIWYLQFGPSTFRGLQDSCESISPSLLNTRIKDLREAKLVTRTIGGYELTELGFELIEVLKPIGKWSQSWASVMSRNNSGS